MQNASLPQYELYRAILHERQNRRVRKPGTIKPVELSFSKRRPQKSHHGNGANLLILSVLNFINCFLDQLRRWQSTSGPYRSSVSSVTFAAETMLSSHGKAYKKAIKKNFNLISKHDVTLLH
jgi:hypothetical protein